MSALKQKMAKTGARASLLAVLVVAALALSGLGASSASAACGATTLTGQGSSLQKVAQTEIWIPMWETECGTEPKIAYESTGSGPGLKAWDFVEPGGGINHERAFIGTDDAPTATQITNARMQADEAESVVVPVGQTAIAIVANLPAECKFEESGVETGITNANLEKAFSGEAKTWAEIGATGTGCTATLTRVVRKEGSGTTFQFKNYLQQIQATPCAGEPEWKNLEEVGAEEKPNITWPECSNMAPERPAGNGGGEVAETVKNMSGTIGYAALPDAKAKGATVLKLQNGESGGGVPTFAKPGRLEEESGKKGLANCVNAVYDVPAGAQSAGTKLNVDWSAVFGANPTIGGANYPLCTLTYDLAWENYQTATFPAGVGTTIGKYLMMIVTNGTLNTVKKWYSVLPSPVAETNNVQLAAERTVEKITAN